MASSIQNTFSSLHLGKILGWSVSAVFLLIILFGSTYVVDQGRFGVVTRWGEIVDVKAEGLHFKWPIADEVTEISASLNRVEVTTQAVSKDMQQIDTKLNVQYQIPLAAVKEAYRNYRDDVKAMEIAVIVPGIETSVKSTTAKYNAEQLIAQREVVSAALKETLSKHLKLNAGVLVSKVDIVNFGFSPSFTKAIEDKVVAAQAVLTEQQNLAKKQVEVQRIVANAKAEAEATRLRADAEAYAIKKQNENANELTVRLREAEAKLKIAEAMSEWRPTVIGATPMVQVEK
jgi:prohibitin 2